MMCPDETALHGSTLFLIPLDLLKERGIILIRQFLVSIFLGFLRLTAWLFVTGIPGLFCKNESNIHQDRKCDKGIRGFTVNNMLLQGFCYIKLKD